MKIKRMFFCKGWQKSIMPRDNDFKNFNSADPSTYKHVWWVDFCSSNNSGESLRLCFDSEDEAIRFKIKVASLPPEKFYEFVLNC